MTAQFKPGSTHSITTLLQMETEALIDEGNAMERDLGRWLWSQRGRLESNRCREAKIAPRSGLPVSLWRTLVLIWATAPEVRQAYSSESRGGLILAVESMDPRTLLSLINALLEEYSWSANSDEAA